jgi:hypothetical protein
VKMSLQEFGYFAQGLHKPELVRWVSLAVKG